jgi:phage shock protein A
MNNNENDNLMQMMRLVLEQVQNMNKRIDSIDENMKQLPTREELMTVQETAAVVEDKSESGYVLINSQHTRLENKIHEMNTFMNQGFQAMNDGFQTTANTLQEIYILNKSLADKVNDLDDDVKDLQKKIG